MKRLLLFALCAMLALCPLMAEAQQEKPDLLGTFTTIDIDGNDQTDALIKEHALTLVNVWGTFCPPCIEEMPYLGELAEEYRDKVHFLGIVCDVLDPANAIDVDQQKLAQEIVAQTKSGTYTHIIPTQGMNERVLYSINAIPTTFFLNDKGQQVGKAIVGSKTKAEWKQILEDTLASMEIDTP